MSILEHLSRKVIGLALTCAAALAICYLTGGEPMLWRGIYGLAGWAAVCTALLAVFGGWTALHLRDNHLHWVPKEK